MIKKIIFPLAITVSFTTHHAVVMDKEDDGSLDASAISARLATLDKELKEKY